MRGSCSPALTSSRRWRSVRQTPAARTCTRTSSAPGCGFGSSDLDGAARLEPNRAHGGALVRSRSRRFVLLASVPGCEMPRNIDQGDRNRKVPEIRAGPATGDSVAGTGGMWARMRQKPFSLWVIAGGLVYMALSLLYLGLPFAIMGGILAGGGFLLILFVFVAVFLIAAAFSFRQKRWAYVLAAVSSLVLLVLFGSFLLGSASNPADSGFWLSMSGLPALTLVVIFSILSLRSAKTGLAQKRYLASPHSTGGLLTLA